MNRWSALAYGGACYLLTVAVVLYAAGFLIDWGVSKSAGVGGEISFTPVAIDLALIALFGLQHSLMARTCFKRFWTRFIPPAIERSTYVLFSNLALIVLFVYWQPLPGHVWLIRGPILQSLIWLLAILGVALVVAASFAFDHWDFFGLRQVWDLFRQRTSPEIPFKIPLLYRFSRHPMMLGLLVALWATPAMTWGRFVFVAGMTIYIFIGVQFEERDLRDRFGVQYEQYRRQAPMFVGLPRKFSE